MVATRTVSTEARNVLRRCAVEDDAIVLPKEILERRLYLEVNAVLEALGCTWSRGRKAHVYDVQNGDDIIESFYTVVETGEWNRPQDYGYYPTPDWLVAKMIEVADVAVNHRVLEPSAGKGAILKQIKKKVFNTAQLAICEILPENQAELKKLGFEVDEANFLDLDCGPLFDRVLMNPPFSKSQALLHVRHAITMLKPGGKLVSIMPSSIMQRQDRLHREVRAEIMRHGSMHPLPEDTFSESGTSVRTVMVTYQKPIDSREQTFTLVATTAHEPQDAPQTAVQGSHEAEVTKSPPRRFQRLSEKPRRFKRARRLHGTDV